MNASLSIANISQLFIASILAGKRFSEQKTKAGASNRGAERLPTVSCLPSLFTICERASPSQSNNRERQTSPCMAIKSPCLYLRRECDLESTKGNITSSLTPLNNGVFLITEISIFCFFNSLCHICDNSF